MDLPVQIQKSFRIYLVSGLLLAWGLGLGLGLVGSFLAHLSLCIHLSVLFARCVMAVQPMTRSLASTVVPRCQILPSPGRTSSSYASRVTSLQPATALRSLGHLPLRVRSDYGPTVNTVTTRTTMNYLRLASFCSFLYESEEDKQLKPKNSSQKRRHITHNTPTQHIT